MSDVVVVNDSDEVIGTMPREEAHMKGVPHRISVIYIENAKNEILVQTRMSGSLDHSCAGHLDPGETYEQAAYRELKEELGIEGTTIKEIGHGTTHSIYPKHGVNSCHVFKVFTCTAEPKQLQKDEVLSVAWKDPEEILDAMKKDKNDHVFTMAFRNSLPIYLKSKG